MYGALQILNMPTEQLLLLAFGFIAFLAGLMLLVFVLVKTTKLCLFVIDKMLNDYMYDIYDGLGIILIVLFYLSLAALFVLPWETGFGFILPLRPLLSAAPILAASMALLTRNIKNAGILWAFPVFLVQTISSFIRAVLWVFDLFRVKYRPDSYGNFR